MKILDGKVVATHYKDRLKKEISDAVAKGGTPGLAVVLIGDNPASQVYVSHKIKACAEVGIQSFEIKKPSTVTQEEVIGVIRQLNSDPKVHGILVQLPLPKHLDANRIMQTIDPHKDVDVLTYTNIGRLYMGRQKVAPCTPSGVIEMLKYYNYPIAGKHAVVIGRSEIVGKPMALLLMQNHATVTICHSKTKDLKAEVSRADIVVVAAGQPQFIGRESFKKDSVVIDVGIHRLDNGKLCGDVNPEGLDVEALAPVPGGVGPMTITMLLRNTFELYKHGQHHPHK
ncbi:MAG: bifunctional methylenetetrahydrofolate dehydrogenase/methenyltetrahydrofolate cyclohydrolase FolD [Bdellovibrionales bacterium]|nr:bifunctional methylenetetrahydrofolate dehydrogenase/methenyltetrahydrofolate cyclohydrolase FolD [Bdellovibrionales bacterium]